MKERLKYLRDMLSFRTMWENQEEEDWEDYDQKDNYISGEEYADDTKELAGIGSGIVYLAIIVMILIAFAAYFIMSRYHLYTGYSVTASYEAEDISGTRYEKLGNGFIKYGSDGVTFVNGKNETQWSSAYTIETPQVDICGETMLIYEQQGYLVEVIDTEGTVGSYQTDLPILKGVIAKNGVAALMLKDDQDVRIRLLSTDGTALAEVRPDGVLVRDTAAGTERFLPCDSVLLAAGMRARLDTVEALRRCAPETDVHIVGDCRKAATISEAVNGAFQACLHI